jgi:cytohesin
MSPVTEARTSGRRRRRAAVLILLVGSVVVAPAAWLSWLSRRYHAEQRLLAAIVNGDAQTTGALLTQGVSPDAQRIFLDYNGTNRGFRRLLRRAPKMALRYVVVPLHRPLCVQTTRIPALQLAFQQGTPDTAELLIEHGADPNVSNERGRTPLHWACLERRITVVGTRSKGIEPRRIRTWPPDPSVVTGLLDRGADAEARDVNGYTTLHIAARNGTTDVLEVLLEAGADPDARDRRGRTPLHWAAELNRPHHLKALLACGAGVNAEDDAGLTPLDLAARAARKQAERILREHGAEPQ